jgi:hypothetical protein
VALHRGGGIDGRLDGRRAIAAVGARAERDDIESC